MTTTNSSDISPMWLDSTATSAAPIDAVPEAQVDIERSEPIRLALVDDDDDYREAASGELTDLGFAVAGFSNGIDMLKSFTEAIDVDVIALDWGLPLVSGIDLLPRLRRQGVQVPVIMLTGRSTPAHERLALDRGAVDFVDKARSVSILAKRLRLVAAPARCPVKVEVDETLHCGRLVLKPRTSRAYWNGADVNLTVTEFNVVRLLASNVGNDVTYRAIYDHIHHVGFIAGSGEHGYRANVRSSIKRIRNKFCAIDGGFSRIENYPGYGYRWGGPLAAA
jgi:two-component system response regulator ChvI